MKQTDKLLTDYKQATPMVANRVMVAHGASQIQFLLFALRDEADHGERNCRDVLLLYAARPSVARRQAMEQLAMNLWSWQEIIWVDDLLEIPAPRVDDDSSERLGGILPEIVDELWVCMPRGIIEQRLMMACPGAELVLFDDGLSTYIEWDGIEQWIRHPQRVFRACQSLGKWGAARAVPWLRNPMPRCWPAKQFTRAHLFLASMLETPRRFRSAAVIRVGTDGARTVMRQTAELVSPGPATDDRKSDPRVLFLPQCFHVGGGISWEQERDVYINVCSQLSDAGIDVVWKEHPKSSRPFLSEIAQRVPTVSSFAWQLPDEWPIELQGDCLAVDACVSATSTSLFTMRKLWGLPTYTCADQVQQFLTGADLDVSHLVQRHIPPVDQLISTAPSRV